MQTNHRILAGTALLIVFLICSTYSGQAAVADQINYQGRLTDNMGTPLSGTFRMMFTLYDRPDGPGEIWLGEQDVEVIDGIYNVQLGASNPLYHTDFDDDEVYLEVKIRNPDTTHLETLSPRQRITTAAFAFKASDAKTLEGKTVSQILDNADGDGFRVTAAQDGVSVVSAGDDGVSVTSAGGDGVFVSMAADDGVQVGMAGTPAATYFSSDKDGFEVAGAEGNGLYVGWANQNGVNVNSAGDHGVYVASAFGEGVYVASAGSDGIRVDSAVRDGVFVSMAADDGVHVNSAGSPTTTTYSILHNGFEVGGAEDNGLYVGHADGDGVVVAFAGDDGVTVGSAGSPTTRNSSYEHDGFQVNGAEGYGLFVGRADLSGVRVESAQYNGLYVASAGFAGVQVASSDQYGIYVGSAANHAGYFNGSVHVTGTLTKGSGTFKIDHPLDPENKYLSHSFVESPDMKNIYDGLATLDANGEVWVELPDWFEALNRDFRYQLTCIGGFAQVHIAEKISNNAFKIAGGYAGLEVSWQVTGIRQDPFAEANPIAVEEDKPPEEQGTYLHPEAYGMPETMGVTYKETQAILDKQKDKKGGGA